MRHAYQCQDAKRHKQSVELRERDARLFEIEFWGSHSNSGDAATLTQTLNQILEEDLDRLWKKALASARARLSRPAETESSDDLQQRFAPALKARSLAVQQFVDPSRRLFPADIEFSSPCATVKLSYQK
jgi:predicted YcjX-like family ATPase